MKRSTFTFMYAILLWLPHHAAARQGGCIDADSVWASAFKQHSTYKQVSQVLTSSQMKIGSMSCYVVNRLDKQSRDTLSGYVLVGGNIDDPVILAYDADAKFTLSDMPKHIKVWLEQYEEINAAALSDKNRMKAWLQAHTSDISEVQPLLGKREWGQSNPYNMLCPTIEGKQCPTGCVATALAQVMCHHKWPMTGQGHISYTTSTSGIKVEYDFNQTVLEWDKLRDAYSPCEDLAADGNTFTRDTQYTINSIEVDASSIHMSKCYIHVNSLTAIGCSSFSGETALALADETGTFVSFASAKTSIVNKSSGRLFSSSSFLLSVPPTLSDGSYHVYSVSRADETDEWSVASVRPAAGDDFVSLEKVGQSFTISQASYPCSFSSEDVMPIAVLMQAVGAAVRMDYGRNASGSNDANTLVGLMTYLGYDSDMFFARPEVFSDRQWHAMLQAELAAGRPVYYTGIDTGSGHAFVIDGFQTSEDGTIYYHVNWGWDGLCNGYYLLNMLRPSITGTGGSSGSNYSRNPSMLVGMKPEDGIRQMKLSCGTVELLQHEFHEGNVLLARIDRMTTLSSNDFRGTLQLALHHDTYGRIVLYSQPCQVTYSRGLNEYYMACRIPAETPAGLYELRLCCISLEGDTIPISSEAWPEITILSNEVSTNGSMTQAQQVLAVSGGTNQLSHNDDGVLTLVIDSLVCPMPTSASGHMAIAVCDRDGRMLAVPSETVFVTLGGYGIKRSVSVSIVLSRYMPDGEYTLRVAMLPAGDSLWTYCDQIFCEGNVWWASFEPYYIPMTVQNGFVYVSGTSPFIGADTPWTASAVEIREGHTADGVLYDMNGRAIATPRQGVYVLKSSNGISKIIK